jgi:hypothetical protein
VLALREIVQPNVGLAAREVPVVQLALELEPSLAGAEAKHGSAHLEFG